MWDFGTKMSVWRFEPVSNRPEKLSLVELYGSCDLVVVLIVIHYLKTRINIDMTTGI